MNMKHLAPFLTYLGLAVLVFAFLHGCHACMGPFPPDIEMEKEKTKQLEIQLQLEQLRKR